MKKSELLRKAVDKYLSTTLSDLDEGKGTCICDCLDRYVESKPRLRKDAKDIMVYMSLLLAPQYTLSGWLENRRYYTPPFIYKGIDPEIYAKTQATRKAWAEWIARQYEEIGQ